MSTDVREAQHEDNGPATPILHHALVTVESHRHLADTVIRVPDRRHSLVAGGSRPLTGATRYGLPEYRSCRPSRLVSQ